MKHIKKYENTQNTLNIGDIVKINISNTKNDYEIGEVIDIVSDSLIEIAITTNILSKNNQNIIGTYYRNIYDIKIPIQTEIEQYQLHKSINTYNL